MEQADRNDAEAQAGGARPPHPTLDYICMQSTREGQASHAHVHEIVRGLRCRGWQVRLYDVPPPRAGRLDVVRRIAGLASVQLAYWRSCRMRPARFVYVRMHSAALPTALLARALGATVVQELNGPVDDLFDAWPRLRPFAALVKFSAEAQARLADEVIVVTPGLVEYVHRLTRRTPCHVVGNGADVALFHPVDRHAADTRPYVVFVGALASWQGIETVLKAAERPEWPSGVDLVIAGDGKERNRVLEATRSNSRVRWCGSISYARSAEVVAGSLAACVPMTAVPRSSLGLSPLKLFEAMACGVPVIASDLPGLADVVALHDCGILVPPGDAGAVARAAAVLATDRRQAMEMGVRGRLAAVDRYSWDVRAGETESVLLSARLAR